MGKFKISKQSRTPATLCPNCGTLLDAATNTMGTQKPSPGDFSVCIRCSAPLRFTESMDVRLLTDEDFSEVPEELRIVQLAAKYIVKKYPQPKEQEH